MSATTVRDAMIQVPSLSSTDPIFLALRTMREHSLPFVPVHNHDGSLYGLVTEGDLIRLIHRATREQSDTVPRWIRGAGRDLLKIQSIKEVVTKQLDTIHPDQSLEEAAELMLRNQRKVLPVVEEGRPVGYLTRSAIIDHLIC